jgi:aspartate/methionine/tyrosine aminotransferase
MCHCEEPLHCLHLATGTGERSDSKVEVEATKQSPRNGEIVALPRLRAASSSLVSGLNRLGLQTSGMDDEVFAETLLKEEGVAVIPGNAFGPGGEGFVRACYATSYEKIEEALQRMERFMNRHG